MKKFIVIYYATSEAQAKTQEMPKEEMQKGMQAWFAWKEKCGDGLVDFGNPLGPGQKVTKDGSSPSDKGAIGYSILQAKDLDGAKKMLEDHPHINWAEGCDIEVYEAMDLPSM